MGFSFVIGAILRIKPMVGTSLLHGATQLRHEARDTLKGINPLWDLTTQPIF